MSEEVESPESFGAGNGAGGADAAAMSLALGSASAKRADAYLAEQIALTRLQAKELSHEIDLRHWSLLVRHVSGLLKLAFEFSVALVLLATVALIANEIWSAAQDEGLVVEAFSVPPDLAARGLTGQVVATQMLDRLSALQINVTSSRAPGSFTNNWGDDLKVEIPETGVSIGQVRTYLHQLLGHQTHITGEVVRGPSGLTVTARVGTEPGKSFSGPEADFDSLLGQAADAVYAVTQPYRYAVHLAGLGKNPEATAFLETVARKPPLAEQIWAYAGLSNFYGYQHREIEAYQAAKTSVSLKPDFAWGWTKVASDAFVLGQAEAALNATRTALRMLDGPGARDIRPEAVPNLRANAIQGKDELLGDYSDAIRQITSRTPALANSADAAGQVQELIAVPGANVGTVVGGPASYAAFLVADHELAKVRRLLAEAPVYQEAVRSLTALRNDIRGQANVDAAADSFRSIEMHLALATQDWARVAQDASALDAAEEKLAAAQAGAGVSLPSTAIWPLRAYADARMGNYAAAHRWIDKTPGDCDLCLRMRGRIDEAEKNRGGADFWFARAEASSPSLPFADEDWGRALLDRGDAAGAIAKFKLSNAKGPHFADPLEGWGEGLMAQNRSDLAVAKFSEANKYAPNWGRLHLKWGEALAYAGKKDEAQKQFALTATLDLTAAEKAELTRGAHG